MSRICQICSQIGASSITCIMVMILIAIIMVMIMNMILMIVKSHARCKADVSCAGCGNVVAAASTGACHGLSAPACVKM